MKKEPVVARRGSLRTSRRRSRLLRFGPYAAAAALLLAPHHGGAVEATGETQRIFATYSPLVVQVRVLDAESGAKAMSGSGFFATASGQVVTNFHVVSEVVHHPERYRIELADAQDRQIPGEILAIDVAHDLAVIATGRPVPRYFAISEEVLSKGRRVYSLGNPYDLGMSIVEGTYNGLLEHSRAERIHFTGGLNPGMSGGPAVLENGMLAGVNVATAGNTVSFLVPAGYVETLIRRTTSPDIETPENLTTQLGEQLKRFQADYVADILSAPVQTVRLGAYSVPTQPAAFFDCGGDTNRETERYLWRYHWCNTNDAVFIRSGHSFELMSLRHRQIESDVLGGSPFHSLYSNFFEQTYSSIPGEDEDFTEFRCETGFVEGADLTFKTVFCARRYQKIGGLYDVVFKAAVLGHRQSGLETALRLSAVSFENAVLLARRHLETLSWTE